MKVFLDGRLVDSKRASISVFDHSFLYGDGIYETVHSYGYKIFTWREHFQRLQESAERIGLRLSWSSAYLQRAAQKVLKANRTPDASLRVTISRGAGPLGLNPDLCPRPLLVILPHPTRPLEALRAKGIAMGIVKVRRNHPQCLDPRIKSNNALNTVQARREATRLEVQEALLLNLDGFLAEGTISNIFFVSGGKLRTPSLECGILKGVTRGIVMRLARSLRLSIQEGRFRPSDLRKAQEVFLTNASWEIMPVVRVVDASGSSKKAYRIGSGRPGPLTRRLQARFEGFRSGLV